MSNPIRQVRPVAGVAGAFAVALVFAAATVSSPAAAAALYFERAAVRTSSEATCFRFAADTARSLQLRNTHSNRLEVAGERNGAYVSMTCIGRGQNTPAMAVVMSVADSFDVARQVGGEAAAKIKGITCFDGC